MVILVLMKIKNTHILLIVIQGWNSSLKTIHLFMVIVVIWQLCIHFFFLCPPFSLIEHENVAGYADVKSAAQ